MNDLAKLASDIRGLSKTEADELIGLLDSDGGLGAGSVERRAGTTSDLTGLDEADWLVAEAISPKSEAAARSRSLDETLDCVRSRCPAVLRTY